MKRLGIAAAFALLLHGLLFSASGRWLHVRPPPDPPKGPVVISLAPMYPQKRGEPANEEKKRLASVTIPEKRQRHPPRVVKKKVKTKVYKKEARKKVRAQSGERVVFPEPPREVKASSQQQARTRGQEKEVRSPSLLSSKAKEIISMTEGKRETHTQTPSLPLKLAVPRYRDNPPPTYPRLARLRGYQGTVILEVLVNSRGRVGDVRLLKSSGYRLLDRAALRSVRKWLFQPAVRGHEKVDTWVKIPIRYRLE